MGLLKAADAQPLGVVHLSLRDIEAEARARQERAERDAEALVAGAESRAAEVRDEALARAAAVESDAAARAAEVESDARSRGAAAGHAAGHAEGFALGLAEGRQQAAEQHAEELTAVVAALSLAIEEVSAARQKVEADALDDVVELAVAIARRVTKRQAEIDPQVMVANLRAALSLTGRGAEIRVAIHPAQRAVLMKALPLLKMEWPALVDTHVVDDESLTIGGCRVFTAHGRIDADLAAQLDRVVSDLLPDRAAGAAAATRAAVGAATGAAGAGSWLS
ncbi:MAG TPA: FliH/SctL family protein [Tepidisphaeraceae bacterium]|nr:FliH/SctL family protein [Tepidisphaeraceae bacterium]